MSFLGPWWGYTPTKIKNGKANFGNVLLNIINVCSNGILMLATFRIKERYDFFIGHPYRDNETNLPCIAHLVFYYDRITK
jgi:hypothetical protein